MVGVVLPMLTQMMSQAVYDIPKINFDAKTVLTNTTPIGAYRGAGRPEATQMVERIIDVAADLMGMDPAELRRKNFLQPRTSSRYTTITGANYDSGEYEKALDAVLAASGYAELRARAGAAPHAGDRKQLGIGVSTYVEITAPLGLFTEYGAVDGRRRRPVPPWRRHLRPRPGPRHRLLDDRLRPARRPDGQGPPRPVRHGRGPAGRGHDGLALAADGRFSGAHRHRGRAGQGPQAGRPPARGERVDDIVKGDGGLQVAGVPAKALSWAELAKAANDPADTDGEEAACSRTSWTSPRATRRSRSARTSPWSRSTSRPAA